MSYRAPERVLLADGGRVLVNGTSMVPNGGDVLIVGAPMHVFGPHPDSANSAVIGVVRSAAGELSLVRSPLPEHSPREPQAAAARGGGWHVIFVTGSWRGMDFDSARVWYAHYDGQHWTRLEPIATAQAAIFAPSYATNPVETPDGGVAYAYPFDHSLQRRSNARGNQGAVMLRRRAGVWTQDTLHTWERPMSMQLGVVGGKVVAFISQSQFVNRRSRGPLLFMAAHDTAWSEPIPAYDPSPDYLSALIRPAGGENTAVITFRRTPRTEDVHTQQLDWGLLVPGDTLLRHAIAEVAFFDGSGVAEFEAGTALFVRDGESRERLRVFVANTSGVRELGSLDVQLLNFRTVAATLDQSRILVLTGGHDAAPGADPPYANYLTEVTVRCPIDRG